MADAVAVITVEKVWMDGFMQYVLGTIAITVSPAVYVANGILMSLRDPAIKASRAPVDVRVQGQGGFMYSYVKGTDNSDGLLRVFAQTNAAVEDDPLGQLAAAAIPAGVSGDTIRFKATFQGQF